MVYNLAGTLSKPRWASLTHTFGCSAMVLCSIKYWKLFRFLLTFSTTSLYSYILNTKIYSNSAQTVYCNKGFNLCHYTVVQTTFYGCASVCILGIIQIISRENLDYLPQRLWRRSPNIQGYFDHWPPSLK